MKPCFALAAWAAFAPCAAAQHQAVQPHPADPAAPVAAAGHDSAFAGYRGFREEPLASWRDSNDEVSRAGGHSGVFGGAHGSHAVPRPPSGADEEARP